MPLKLKDLLPPEQIPLCVQASDPVEKALEHMRHHEFSQLPIVDGERRCLGEVVTFSGIVQAMVSMNTHATALTVSDVRVPAKVYREDEDPMAALGDIQSNDFVLIVDDEDKIVGLVSTADTTEFFRHRAQDFMLIEDIETSVKEAIEVLYAEDNTGKTAAIESITDRASEIRRRLPAAIRAYLEKQDIPVPPKSAAERAALMAAENLLALPKAGKPFDRLSFDEFIQLLLKHPKAPKLEGAKDSAEVRKMLEQVRDARNKLAHFRGDISAVERSHIRYTKRWLENNLPESMAVPPEIAKSNFPTHVEGLKISTTLVSGEYVKVGSSKPSDTEIESAGEDTAPSGSYAKLSEALRRVQTDTTSVTLTFGEIEQILEKQLPRSAFEYRAWWANQEDSPQAVAWLSQSWKTQAVSMNEKRLTFVRTDERQNEYISFFSRVRALLRKSRAFTLRAGGPQGTNWDPLVYLDQGGRATIIAVFGRKKRFRIELYLDDGDAESTRATFDQLSARKMSIEKELGFPVEWQSLDKKRACRIAVATDGSIPADVDNAKLHEWAAKHALAFHRVFKPEFAAQK